MTRIFNNPTDDLQITATKLQSAPDLSLTLQSSNVIIDASLTVRHPVTEEFVNIEEIIVHYAPPVDLTTGTDASFTNVDISDVLHGVDASFTNVDISNLLRTNNHANIGSLAIGDYTTRGGYLYGNENNVFLVKNQNATLPDSGFTFNVSGNIIANGSISDGSATLQDGFLTNLESLQFADNTTFSPSTNGFVIDPQPSGGDTSGTLIIKGDLQVDGTTTTINSTTLTIEDTMINIAKNATTHINLNGTGITFGAQSGFSAANYSNGNSKPQPLFYYVDGASPVLARFNFSHSVYSEQTMSAKEFKITNGSTITSDLADSISNSVLGLATAGNFIRPDANNDLSGLRNFTATSLSDGFTTISGGVISNTTIVSSNVLASSGNTSIGGILYANGHMELSGNLTTKNNTSQVPVTFSTFERKIDSIQTQDLSALGGVDNVSYQDATNWDISRIVLSGHSYIKMEFKVNFISSPEFDQTLSFRVLRSLNGGNYDEANPIFEDNEIGSNMGVTIRGVYNGTYIDDLAGSLNVGETVAYKLQVKRNKASGDTIQTPFGIVPGGNYIFLQELYQPSA